MSRRESDIDKYFLIGDDVAICRLAERGAFLCARREKEYIILVRNKRRSREMCWRRGSQVQRDGEWMMGCPYHMQLRLGEIKRGGGKTMGMR